MADITHASRREFDHDRCAVGYLDVHCTACYVEAVVSEGGRVYVFTLFMPVNGSLLESFLRTVRLTPANAKN